MVWKYAECQPDQKIPSNADIAGPGVMAAFVVTAWVTIFTSSTAMLHSWPRVYKNSPSLVQLSVGAESLLGPLCDLQVITGGAILLAGFSQWHTITYYHRELVIAYYWLAWNSFWNSRSAYMYNACDTLDSSWSKWRVYARRSLVTISVALGIVYLSLSIRFEDGGWDPTDPKRCYNYADRTYSEEFDSYSWSWIAGLCLYEFTLLVSFVDREAKFARRYNKGFADFIKNLQCAAVNNFNSILQPPSTPGGRGFFARLKYILVSLLFAVLTVTFFTLRQLLSFWTYGHDRTVAYCVFSFFIGGWNTYDIFMLKVMNAHLVEDGEMALGYGQILSIAILLQIPLAVLDIWKDPEKRAERRASAIEKWEGNVSWYGHEV